MRVIVVGGGVLGTMHAWQALSRGHEVVQLEREPAARGASVRNFGLVWVSGRAEGAELSAALRARQLWAELAVAVPALGFRPAGSLTVARTDAELAIARRAAGLPSAAARGFAVLTPAEVRQRNPALAGEYAGALWCERDAVVEPRTAQVALRAYLKTMPGYRWLPGREVRAVDTGWVRDDRGETHHGDAVVVCTGAWLSGLARELAPGLPVRRVRLQMLQTEPLEVPLTTAVADGDSFRYYPAYDGAALGAVQPQEELARQWGMQLLMVQRLDGCLTIGDTHAYERRPAGPAQAPAHDTEPFDFDLDEQPYDHLTGVAGALLGRPLPPVRRRWAGVYAQCLDPTRIVHREAVRDGVWLVTGPGGRGMTCSPAIAETTMTEAGL